MAPHTDSSSIRYLKARLRVLKKPAVWGSLGLMILTLSAFAVYWKYSKTLGTGSQAQSPWSTNTGSDNGGVASLDGLSRTDSNNPIPSQSDSAIGADIDTLPLLLNDFNNQSTTDAPTGDPQSTESPSDRPKEEDTADARRSRSVLSSPLTLISPGDRNTQSSPGSGAGNLNSGLLNLDSTPINLLPSTTNTSGSGLTQGGGFSRTSPLSGQPANAAPANALQSALDRNNASAPSRTQPSSTSFQLLPGQVPQPGLASQSGQGFVQSAPTLQTSPPLGSTGYTVPQSLRLSPLNGSSTGGYSGYGGYSNVGQQPGGSPAQPYSNLTPRPLGSYQPPFQQTTGSGLNVPQSSGYAQPQVSGYQAPNNGATIRQQQPARFSYPGRPIGNGQIGTFGNPTVPRQ